MRGKRQRSNSCSVASSTDLTIYDAPNVCRELMAKSSSLASRLEGEAAKEAEEIGALAKRMLDAILTAVDQLLALPIAEQAEESVANDDLPVLANEELPATG